MTDRYRFSSDTNRQLFVQALDDRHVDFRDTGLDVYVEGWHPWLADLAASLNGLVVDQDDAHQTTSGLDDAGFRDGAAFATRSNPPDVSRGAQPPDYSTQIVDQQMKRWPNRRKTRSQS